MTLTERITQAVADYPDWSPAEHRQLPAITKEILRHVREGTGNAFIAEWCTRYLTHILEEHA